METKNKKSEEGKDYASYHNNCKIFTGSGCGDNDVVGLRCNDHESETPNHHHGTNGDTNRQRQLQADSN